MIHCRTLLNMALITMEPKTNESFSSIVRLLLYITQEKYFSIRCLLFEDPLLYTTSGSYITNMGFVSPPPHKLAQPCFFFC